MDRRSVLIIALVAFSTAATVYAVYVGYYSFVHVSAVISHHGFGTFVGGHTYIGQQAKVTFPYKSIPIILLTIGWAATGYELLVRRKREISKTIKKEISGNADGWVVYDAFKGKGGARRLLIMQFLDSPKKRSEIAKRTDTDWKEVDRNIRILESVDLVMSKVHDHMSPIYELTEKGHRVLEKVRAVVQEQNYA